MNKLRSRNKVHKILLSIDWIIGIFTLQLFYELVLTVLHKYDFLITYRNFTTINNEQWIIF